MDASVAGINTGEEVKAYKIHVSSKYLDLTKKKLELTRLPHELLVSTTRKRARGNGEWDYGTPKREIEPLIDFWLEHYSWRIQETHLNTTLPQFRTAIKIPDSNIPLRIHFLHIKSPHPNAIPLLLIPTFPLTNLSLTPLFTLLTHPANPTSTQSFHLVVPNIPGLGFSDSFQSDEELLLKTAGIFDTLMLRLGYHYYLASSTGSGRDSPTGIDYHLARLLGERHKDSCLGVHLIEPLVKRPNVGSWAWMKFSFAVFFHAPVFGYVAEDFTALRAVEKAAKAARLEGEARPLLATPGSGYGAVGMIGLREPNTFSYALCDSPVGLLSLVCSALRRKAPNHKLSNTEIIDVTQLAWLPGPEAAARFWAAAVEEIVEMGDKKGKKKSRVAVTEFGVDGVEGEYFPPAWASGKHVVVFSQRVTGRAGLVVWERADVLVDGVRGLAREVERLDSRLKVRELDAVVVHGGETIPEEAEGEGEVQDGREHVQEQEQEQEHGMQLDVESPDTVVAVDMS